MKAMEEKIISEGEVLPGNVLKVGSFLNQQIDTAFMDDMAKAAAGKFSGLGITKVITIESSGIPFATLVALYLGCRAVIVKKHASANQSKDVYSAEIYSYTHGNYYTAAVAKEYLQKNDRILIADDFLACGNAIHGLRKIIADAGAELVGCAIAVEKGFQHGGDELRAAGIRVESLAIVDSMTDGKIVFRN